MNKYYELMLERAAKVYAGLISKRCPFCEAVSQNAKDMAKIFRDPDLGMTLNMCVECPMVNLARRWGYIDENEFEYNEFDCEVIGQLINAYWHLQDWKAVYAGEEY
ncbi:MAG: hypothetical protein JRJ29_00325 [Deltaproteobacteria bacterium]|nr:hypothetical protein [Deltaproteobacteria bacterium]MBW2081612.1 hypothetical protein [Deltaproteobacteria bacterium]